MILQSGEFIVAAVAYQYGALVFTNLGSVFRMKIDHDGATPVVTQVFHFGAA